MLSPEDIEKFIPFYPEIDEKVGYEILKKKEFNDLILERSEGEKQPGELLDSQKFMKRFFSPNTPYDNALIFHLMGTGKCVHPLTKISTNKGLFKAEDIWKNYNFNSFVHKDNEMWASTTENILVTSYDESKMVLVERPIKNLFRQYVNENLVSLTLENESSIIITQKHHLFNGVFWTNNFKVGDDIAIPDKDIILFSRITKINFVNYIGWVYDFEIEEHHNYIANNILCHNTCVSSAVVENFKNEEVNGKPHKPALVFVKSKALEKIYANDISKICTKEVYTAKVKAAEMKKEGFMMTEEAKTQRIAKSIKQVYSIVTYETFLKHLEPDEILKQKFSNRVIIIDEAHTLRIQPSKKKKATHTKQSLVIDEEDEEPAFDQNEDAENLEENQPAKTSTTLYKQMHHFLHTVENCRILLLTGTPIWDRTSEIASLMNLILDMDNQLPTGSKFNSEFFDGNTGILKASAKEILINKFRGKVSFLRQMVTTAKREEQGTKEPWLKYIKVFPCKMSDFQSKYAEEAKNKLEITTVRSKKGTKQRTTKGGAVRRLERYATNIVIPLFDKKGNVVGGSYDKKTFEQFALSTIARPDGKGHVKKYRITNEYLRRELKNNLEMYSAKFAAMIDHIKKHPDEVTFIYNESVSGPGGVLMFALCLELHGFEWAKSAGDIGKKSNRKRFAVISGDSQTTSGAEQIQKLLESHNKPDNCYGSRLQVIIGSEKVALGFTVKHVRRIYITTPSWNIPSIDQALARGFRFGSHNALKEEERYINIYRLVAVEDGKYAKGTGFPENSGFSKVKTSDIEVYELAENKEYKNTQIYRILKEASFDCAVNYKRNVLPEDQENTKECDYMQCNYICDSFPSDKVSKKGKVYSYNVDPKDIDRTTYDLFYSDEKVDEYVNKIRDLFNNYFSLNIDSLKQLLDLKDEEMFLLLRSIDRIIEDRILIRNRYGFLCYLKEQDNFLFLDNSTSSKPNYSETKYIETPLVTERTTMGDLIEIFELKDDRKLIADFCENPSDKSFNKFSYGTKIILLESVSTDETSDKNSEMIETIKNNMKDKIKVMSDGTKIHTLYTEEFKGVSYDVSSKKIKVTGLMRYYDVEEQKWDFVKDKKKEEVYVEEINSSKVKHYMESESGYSGWISSVDKTFRVVKEKGRGRVCKTLNGGELIKIFLEIGAFPKAPKEYKNIEKEDLMTRIQSKYPFLDKLDEKDETYLRNLLYVVEMKKPAMCEELKNWFRENNLLKIE